GRGRLLGRAGGGAPARDGLEALAGAHARARGGAARGHEQKRNQRKSAGRYRARYQIIRALWVSREPFGELRVIGICELLFEGAPSGGILRVAPQQLADGLLSSGVA